jgi:hypothetical protein
MIFVLIVTGEENLNWLNLCVFFLKRNTSKDILVIHDGVDGIHHKNKMKVNLYNFKTKINDSASERNKY